MSIWSNDMISNLCILDDVLLCTYSNRDLAIDEGPDGLKLRLNDSQILSIPKQERHADDDEVWTNMTELVDDLSNTVEKRYNCNKCDYRTKSFNDLRSHKYRKHGKEKPYHCNVCVRQFSSERKLKIHKKNHSKKRPFECKVPDCSKRFIKKAALVVHMRSHTDERPYKCKVCDKRFQQQGNLDQHVNRHLGILRFHCDVCGIKFVQKTQLERHQKTACVEEIHSLLFKDCEDFKNPRLHKNQKGAQRGTQRDKRKIPKYRSNLILNGENDLPVKHHPRNGPKVMGQTWRKKPHQREKLEAYFETVENHPDKRAIAVIAKEIGLSAKVVTHWFMNQRAKGKVFQISSLYYFSVAH